jgi:hypothetical protein
VGPQRTDAHAHTNVQPRVEVLPSPVVHPDLAALAALAAAYQDAATGGVKVALGEAERLADAQPGSPEQDD